MTKQNKLTFAIAKGRIMEESLPLLAEIGIKPKEDINRSRKLIFPTNHPHIDLIIVRATDVPAYVSHCATDLGIAGKDTLLEYLEPDFYEMLDLKISPCKLMVAGLAGSKIQMPPMQRVSVATKYPETTKKYFASKNRSVEIIKLYGSMELAPVTGLADYIVDIVDTGKTLQQNGLEALETIMPISSRLIVSKNTLKTKYQLVNQLISDLKSVI